MNHKTVEWKVSGMDCTNCAASIQRFLERKGMEDVFVNFASGEVRFIHANPKYDLESLQKGVHKLGYTIQEDSKPKAFWTLEKKLLVSAIFTAPLLFNHLLMMAGLGIAFLENPWIQLIICLPVFTIGLFHFGGSALGSLRGGIPNMDVLIFMGSTAAFIYSLAGSFMGNPNMIFYETAATIITLVLVGNYLEKRSVQQTTTSIKELTRLQATTARKIMPSGTIIEIPSEEVKAGDLLQVNEGDQIPTDGRIESGNAQLDESMLTGESELVSKGAGDRVIGASIIQSGHLQMQATAVGADTVLNQMIELVKTAQREKPDIQRLADRISAIFVPVVVSIALLTLLIGHFGFNLSFQQALMNSIAVLVISCPCAMGLATPTAVTVGVGRLARNGILVKGGKTLEIFASIKRIVFDKTGTLTTGQLEIDRVDYREGDPDQLAGMIYQLEKHSSHPIAKSLRAHFHPEGKVLPEFIQVEEQKGVGVFARDHEGHDWKIGSNRILNGQGRANGQHSLYLLKDKEVAATIDLKDEIKEDARDTIQFLKKKELETIILSGDRRHKTAQIAELLGIDHYYAEQLPEEKFRLIEQLSAEKPTAMVGDGINDAPALARATVGISLSDASQAAIQSAEVVLLNGQLHRLKDAFAISQHTLTTIKQNLFWAFAYNIVAIPVAAMGFLNPMWGALFMAFSDVIVIGNSIRLKYKRIKVE